MLYPWQSADWARLTPLFERWPHALLLYGPPGIGRADFGRHLAARLLCEAADAGARPCGECVACRWLAQGNHPDFRAVLPANIAAELGAAQADEAGADAPNDADAGGAEAPAQASTEGGKGRAPSKEIRIEQVRALFDFCAVGSHRGGNRVVLLYPAEALNTPAANALLKMLEEPPAGVAFILIAGRIDRVLPTILSRCRKWPLTQPDSAAAVQWLQSRGVEQPAAALAEAGGAPLTAAALASDPHRALKSFALEQLAAGAQCDVFACGEALQKVPVPVVLGWLQRWLYDLLAQHEAGRIRYHPGAVDVLRRMAAALDAPKIAALLQFARAVNRQRAVENHPLNARLVFESLFLQYRDVFTAAAD